ncbi:MAG: VOC family protein [Clostridiales bacterium]|nr:VOC family protein [Clostridiales bacterium]
MAVVPNFQFGGKCKEAIELYKNAFGAEIACMLLYKDAKKEDYNRHLTNEQKNFVYHAEIFIGSQRIMLADNIDIPFAPSTSLFLTVTMDTKEDVIKAFNIMKDGCTIIHPPHSTTYSSCTVNFIDKYGFRWVIMTEQTDR